MLTAEEFMPDRTDRGSYGQFCPVSMAAEIVCNRWTALVVRELLCGTTRFNDLRRGVPRMSPSLLSKRLKELEEAGVIAATPSGQPGVTDYKLTRAGEDLRGVIMSLGMWGQRWIESDLSLKNLDPTLLMWDIRRNLQPTPLPPRRCIVKFTYPELRVDKRCWWLVIDDEKVDLCGTDPGYDVDLFIQTSLRTMTAVWMGVSELSAEVEAGNLQLTGDKNIIRSMDQWLGVSVFAKPAQSLAS
jgi:DNA-binding HxlR family transcriptional regulator